MSDAHTGELAHHFESLEQQKNAATLGMWAFLAQEIMFFGGLFATYLVYRRLYPGAFLEGSHHLPVFWGTLNTAVLIGSSLTMALAVHSAQIDRSKRAALFLFATMGLALVFLGVKAHEYSAKYHDGLIPGVRWMPEAGSDPHLNIFFAMYFIMTGVHALHMVVGVAIMLVVSRRALRGHYTSTNHNGIEVLGLYWHFVDLVWIFLFPLLYLLSRNIHA